MHGAVLELSLRRERRERGFGSSEEGTPNKASEISASITRPPLVLDAGSWLQPFRPLAQLRRAWRSGESWLSG